MLFLADSSTYYNTVNLPLNKSVVLFYFGPKCPHSRVQMQGIIDKMDQFKDIQFIIFTTAPFSEMKWFYNKYELNKYPNIKTGVDFSNYFVKYFNIWQKITSAIRTIKHG